MPKEIGLSHTDGVNAFYSVDPSKSFPILCAQGSPGVLSPAGVGSFISDERAIHDAKRMVVIVEGDVTWCKRYQGALPWADVVVYITSAEALSALGVQCLDCDWSPSQPPIGVLENLLASRMASVGPG